MAVEIEIGTGADDVSRVYAAAELLSYTNREAERAVIQVATTEPSGEYRIDLEATLFHAYDPWAEIGTLRNAIAAGDTQARTRGTPDPAPDLTGFMWNRIRFGTPSDSGETAVITAVSGGSRFTIERGAGAAAHAAGTPVWLFTPEHPALWQPIAEFDSAAAGEFNKPTLVDIAGGHLRFRRVGTGTQDPVRIAME